MKNILGLDLGTNSIGWAIVKEENGELNKIIASGSRILPMDASIMSDFEKGNKVSQTAERTSLRGTRRLLERQLLRRERLHRVLSLMNFLPEHYDMALTRYGKFKDVEGEKLAWKKREDGTYDFIFKDAFNEMMTIFARQNPEYAESGKKIPYDWTVYYLRHKALTEKISKEELAWVLLNFCQKRGYSQIRGLEEEQTASSKTRQYIVREAISSIEDTGEEYRGNKIFDVTLSNGEKGKLFRKELPQWVGMEKFILVTVDLDKDGNDKLETNGEVSRRFKVPTEDEWDSQWALLKMRTEDDIDKLGVTVGTYILNSLIHEPSQKVRGRLVRVVERKYYVEELRQILSAQMKFHLELKDAALYEKCVEELYPSNESHRNILQTKGFDYLFINDIIFYQRPLKSKKSLISECPYESYKYVNKETGEIITQSIKCIPKSHPLFQEFRLWNFIKNLRILKKEGMVNGKLTLDIDVTDKLLPDEKSIEALFCWLNDRKEINEKALLSYAPFNIKKQQKEYRWNYVEDKSYPCNETRAAILKYMKESGVNTDLLTKEFEESLWHLLYSIGSKAELIKALTSFAEKHSLSDSFIESFTKFPPFVKEYGAYSAKAIRKILALTRTGKFWKKENIDKNTLETIDKMLKGEFPSNLPEKAVQFLSEYTAVEEFKGMPEWAACYVVYGRHSEATLVKKWTKPEDIDMYLKGFKQHSLRNPIVEQLILETLRVVRDLWKKYEHIDEIHVEVGREMKQSAKARAATSRRNLDNENTNMRIRYLLEEFAKPVYGISDVRPYSPYQQELLKIYEDYVLSNKEVTKDIQEIIKGFAQPDEKKRPSHNDVMKYKMWLEQGYRSPYTGKMIPLSRLFTRDYEIEHVIPQSLYYDNSFNNKVICESEVNGLKANLLGYSFIKEHGGEKLQVGMNREWVEIYKVKEYEEFVREHYKNNKQKMEILLSDELPEGFTQRQLNDTRYITKLISLLLSNIVREEDEREPVTKKLLMSPGKITDRLKEDWGVKHIWNRIILPRFERMNELYDTNEYTYLNTDNKVVPTVPLDERRGYVPKRLDHRHHAMDAIVIACVNRNIINYLNNDSAHREEGKTRTDLKRILCTQKPSLIDKPWRSFTTDVEKSLRDIVVSIKKNNRVINRTANYYQCYENGKKIFKKQNSNNHWAIRKSLHKDTVHGLVNLRFKKNCNLNQALKNVNAIVDKALKAKIKELLALGYKSKEITEYFKAHAEDWAGVNTAKPEIYYYTNDTNDRYYATRKPIDTSFNEKKICESVTDTGIQKIMLNHLAAYNYEAKEAFSPEGIEEMNKNITQLNEGKFHQPIYKVRVYEKAVKFAVGEKGNKSKKYVEAAKGTNLFFAVYEKENLDEETGKVSVSRTFSTIPFYEVMDRAKKGLGMNVPNEDGLLPKFVLSPNDLVYLPTAQELHEQKIQLPIDRERIYKVVSLNKNQCFCIKACIATVITNGKEFSPLNKMERAVTGEMIKETCVPLKVSSIGEITEVGDIKLE